MTNLKDNDIINAMLVFPKQGTGKGMVIFIMHKGKYVHIDKEIKLIKKKLKEFTYMDICELNIEGYLSKEPLSYADRKKGEHKIFKKGDKWGGLFDCCWFHFTCDIPNKPPYMLYIDISGEGLVFDDKGVPVRGLTTFASTFDTRMGMPEKCVCPVVGNKVDVWVDAGANDLFGELKNNGTIVKASLVSENKDIKALYYDFELLIDLADALSDDKARKYSILNSLHKAGCLLREYTSEEALSARDALKTELSKKGGDSSLSASAIGHAHIDLAWLWPIRETKRKVARTFATALSNMDLYKNYRFIQSQPQSYEWCKQDYPALYEKVKDKVKAGQWEVEGGMWVEADTNISGGESLIRQFLYGKQYIKEEFGKDSRLLWLPDVFGYSGNMPQIMKKCGVDYFMTIKLSWNFVNKFPHHSFIWKGIDGSEVVSHMPPEGNYLSSGLPHAVLDAEKSFFEKGISDKLLLPYGIGDGGGGPGEEHLERLERQENLEGSLPVKQEFAIDFFESINEKAGNLPVYKGELYLERHRGTYTSQAKSKKYNRKIEYLFKETEYLSAYAKVLCESAYPYDELKKMWKEYLLLQFHDVLPGTSIDRVYLESEISYEEIKKGLSELKKSALSCLAEKYCTNGDKIYFNTTSFEREAVSKDNKVIKLPPLGVGFYSSAVAYAKIVKATESALENDKLKVTFEKGMVTSIYDKTENREALSAPSNDFCLYCDNDNAWEGTIYYNEKEPFKSEFTGSSTENGTVIMNFSVGNSKITQRISLNDGRVDFKTYVDWKEKHKVLRVKFYPNIEADYLDCDIQFGSIKRPVHQNTSFDAEMIEVCAHKWVDISDGSYGVAMLNDCKYGYRSLGGNLDMCLLRAPTHPGKTADVGEHEFTYSIYPHKGNYAEGNVVEQGCSLNTEPSCAEGSADKNTDIPSIVSLDGSKNIVFEALKMSENNDGVIARLYEAEGRNGNVKISSSIFKNIVLCNMIEEDIEASDGEFTLKPFEVLTLRLK